MSVLKRGVAGVGLKNKLLKKWIFLKISKLVRPDLTPHFGVGQVVELRAGARAGLLRIQSLSNFAYGAAGWMIQKNRALAGTSARKGISDDHHTSWLCTSAGVGAAPEPARRRAEPIMRRAVL